MKIYFKIFLTIVAVTFFSCDASRVDSPPIGATEASFFKDNVEFRQALTAVYAKLYDYYYFNNWNNWVSGTWYLPGDDLTETNGVRTSVELFDGTLNPTNFQMTFTFDKSYELIARANVMIEKVNTIDFSDLKGADEIASMEGEALFLRAYAYFKLFNIYGNVPIILERILLASEANTPKSDKMEVLDRVIADAEAAITSLPESWPQEFAGRATKNSARGLLAKALVFRANYTGNNADYTQAISVFNSISGARLVDTYTDNFNSYTENNEESLFEVQASTATGIDNIFLYNDGPWRGVEMMSIYRGYNTVNGTTAANWATTKFLITRKLLDGFGDDPRIAVFLSDSDGFNGRLFQKYTLPGMNELTNPFRSSANNERVIRYGDIKLLIAEAALKTGNAAAAIGHLNDIRTRAREWGLAAGISDGTVPADYPTTETNTTTIMQWIMDERFVELAGEGHRWWDLKRWHESGDMNLTGWDGSDQYFSTNLASPVQFDVNKHLLFPLPQTEIERNEAITENNPGY